MCSTIASVLLDILEAKAKPFIFNAFHIFMRVKYEALKAQFFGAYVKWDICKIYIFK